MKNGTTTSSRNAAISPYSSDIARILLGNIHGRADAPHPALAGCAHAVSGHVAAVHIGSFLRRGNPDPRMSLVGQTLPSRDFCGTAALPLKPDIGWRGWHVRKVPSSGHSLLKRQVNFATPMIPVASSEPTLGAGRPQN